MTTKTAPDPLSVRFTNEDRRLLEKAAKITKKGVSVLVREAAKEAAAKIITRNTHSTFIDE